ncbi:MAG: DUF4381 domain-containing protein [Gammaproteobacteria bacterium]
MEEIDPLEIPLRDIHLPDPISWWPLAPGWWVLVAIILFASLACWLFLRRKRNKHRKQLKHRIDQIEQQYAEHNDAHVLAKELSVLTRQIALLEAGPGSKPAATMGTAWAEFWRRQLQHSALSVDELNHALNVAPYKRDEKIDGEKIITAIRQSLSARRPARGKPASSTDTPEVRNS